MNHFDDPWTGETVRHTSARKPTEVSQEPSEAATVFPSWDNYSYSASHPQLVSDISTGATEEIPAYKRVPDPLESVSPTGQNYAKFDDSKRSSSPVKVGQEAFSIDQFDIVQVRFYCFNHCDRFLWLHTRLDSF